MHKCVRCGSVYEDDDTNILRGCSCGSVFFLYIRGQQEIQEVQRIEKELEARDTSLEKEIAEKISEIKKIGKRKREVEEIKFGIETVRIPREGVYEINIDALMKKRPLIILERGTVYFIHLPSVFDLVRD